MKFHTVSAFRKRTFSLDLHTSVQDLVPHQYCTVQYVLISITYHGISSL
jgi:hypothetical protein